MTPGRKSLDKVVKHLYDDVATLQGVLTPSELKMKTRFMLCVTRKLDNPLTSDRDLVTYLMSGCGGLAEPVGQSQAYRDIAAINMITGNIQLASKNWMRHMIVEGAKDIYQKALNRNDFKGAAAALDKLGKYTRCDKEDDAMDWSEMLPPVFEPSDDITLIDGLDVMDGKDIEKERKRLRSLFNRLSTDAQDAQIIDDDSES
jgi:hypothetical protein